MPMWHSSLNSGVAYRKRKWDALLKAVHGIKCRSLRSFPDSAPGCHRKREKYDVCIGRGNSELRKNRGIEGGKCPVTGVLQTHNAPVAQRRLVDFPLPGPTKSRCSRQTPLTEPHGWLVGMSSKCQSV